MSSEGDSPQSDSGAETVPADTLDFLFEYTREAPQRQLEAMSALDTKAFALFSASAVVVGLASVGIWGRQELPSGAGILLVLAVAAFIAVAYAVLDSVRLRRYRSADHADVLWQEYWDLEVSDIKHALVDDIAKASKHNEEVIRAKTGSLGWALVAAITETSFVGASLAWSSLA